MDSEQVLSQTQDIVQAVSSLTAYKLLMALGVLIAGLVLIRLLLKGMDKLLTRFRIEKTLGGFLHSTLRIILIFVLMLTLADQLGIPVTSLVAVLSLFALAISLSVQNVLANMVSGVVILSAKPFSAGDYVETASTAGTIETISLMYTLLVTPDNRQILVPNAELSSTRITNFSAKPLRRVDISLTVDYAYDNETVIKALEKVCVGDLILRDDGHAPEVVVTGYGETGVQYALRVWVKQKDYWPVLNGLLRSLRGDLQKEGIILGNAMRRIKVEQ